MSKRSVRLSSSSLTKLRHGLLAWYYQNRRELPWRVDRDPYRVWLSEIMLQQTRVAAVLDHYERFLRRFPTLQTLASARESSVLTIWSGLGYYHRARRMHQAAKIIVRKRKGEFPRTAEEWRELPGVGRYTAAAIASIAFGEAVAVVDGNVERILGRVFGKAAELHGAWLQAEVLLDRKRPGDFNQAMMELGATVCTPQAPQCQVCPLNTWCQNRGAHSQRSKPLRKRKQLSYALARSKGAVLLVQRPANASLMAGMWELPTVPESEQKDCRPLARLRHSITDTDYQVSVTAVLPNRFRKLEDGGRWFTRRQWELLPLTGLTRKVLRNQERASSSASMESK